MGILHQARLSCVNQASGMLVLQRRPWPHPRRKRQEASASSLGARFFSGSDAIVSSAKGVLDAAVVPVKRLTLTTWYPKSNDDEAMSCYQDLVKVVLSHPAACRVEELLLDAKDPKGNPSNPWVYWKQSPNLQQLETLRILELTSCRGLLDHTRTKLRRLSSLRLSHCFLSLASLQRLIDASPALAVIRLENVSIEHKEIIEDKDARKEALYHLQCPATTMLVLDSCMWPLERRCIGGWYYQQAIHRLEIDATRLRRFSYKGSLRSYSFSPRPLEFEQVDLEFLEQGYRVKDPDDDLEIFWRFTRNFTSTKKMRLTVKHLEDIAVLTEARQVQQLPAFSRLERLEFQGAYWTKDKTAPLTTILNLLQCCPVLSVLRTNLTPKYEEASDKDKEEVRKRTTRKEILAAAMVGPRCLLQCLQSSLKRVDLQFQLEKRDCFGVKLMKFFAENAMVLEEMCIDSGDG